MYMKSKQFSCVFNLLRQTISLNDKSVVLPTFTGIYYLTVLDNEEIQKLWNSLWSV